MRKIEDMHWYLWEAISLQARDMLRLGLVGKGLVQEVNEISTLTRISGKFSDELRLRACQVEAEMELTEDTWQELVAKEAQDEA